RGGSDSAGPAGEGDRWPVGDLSHHAHHARSRGIHARRDRGSSWSRGRYMQEQARGGSRTTARDPERPARRNGVMKEEQFERLMKDAAETYNRPPVAPLDEMWASIDAEAFGSKAPARRVVTLIGNPWLRMAAVLVLGIAIGRGMQKSTPAPAPQATVSEVADSYQLT